MKHLGLRTLFAGMVALAGAALVAAHASAAADSVATTAPGYGVAMGIANLARSGEQVNIPAVAAQLQLPDMAPSRDRPGALVWHGPLQRRDAPLFYAVYDPPHASLNITHVIISWLPSTADAFVLELRVEIKPGFCPSEALLARLVGDTPQTTHSPRIPADGFPGSGPIKSPGAGNAFVETSLETRQSAPDAAVVTYRNHNTCFLIVTGRRR